MTLEKTQLIYSGLRETELGVILPETELWAVLPQDAVSSQYDSFSGKIVWKKPFLSETWGDSAHLFRSQGDRDSSHSPRRQSFKPCSHDTELWAVLPQDAVSNQYDSFSGKMVLKRPFLSDTGEDSTHLFSTVLASYSWIQEPINAGC